MAAPLTVCITGSTDGIGLAAARQLTAEGHRVVVHARSEERGRPVADELGGGLVVGDLAVLDEVRGLADQLRDLGGVDVLAHNAGVWVRDDTPRVTADGFETTFAVNVLAPHVLTSLAGDAVRGRLLWLGSGMAASGRPKPTALGGSREPRQAYADSKACDVALALGWARRRPDLLVAAVDPGWVKTKLASGGAPGEVEQGGDGLAFCCTADLGDEPYWKDRAPTTVPGRLRDAGLQDALLRELDRLGGLGVAEG
ncbi:MAG: short-chain dehydrogenase/reductase [Frankiales bacterium]|nr:short-chain dehydrogenase/reductase [Frankiales bacterium]